MGFGTKTEQVAATLEGELLRGRYPGALPSHGELARRFGVCVSTIREAVARLKAKGLVTVRPRHGIQPLGEREWTFDRMPEAIGAHRLGAAGTRLLSDYLEARRILLAEIVSLACVRRTTEHLATISFLIFDLEHTAQRRPQEQVERCERDVTEALVEATGSQVMLSLLRSIESLIGLIPPQSPWMAAEPSVPIRVYHLLVDCLERRAAEPARQLVLEALLQSDRLTAQRFKDGPPGTSLEGEGPDAQGDDTRSG